MGNGASSIVFEEGTADRYNGDEAADAAFVDGGTRPAATSGLDSEIEDERV